MTVTAIHLPDGSDVNAADATCEGCGSPMTDHSCGGTGTGAAPARVYVRRAGPRAPVTAIPTCAHCTGRIHQNLSGAAVNSECIIRQYALDKGLMTDPFGNLPVATIELWSDIVAWATSLATPLTYGKMPSAAGGAGTYAGLRPKTGRKKKTAPAAPGMQIQDMADDEEIVMLDEEPAETKPKAKKSRGKKAKADTNGTTGVTWNNEMLDAEEVIAVVPIPATDPEEEAPAPVAAVASDEDKAREERAARRAARKAALAGTRK